MKILLIIPPFASTKWPSMGCSLLKSLLMDNNIDTEVLYLNILFRKIFYFDYYERVIDSINFYKIGEILFAPYAFPLNKKKIKKIFKKNKSINIENIGKRNTNINEINEISKKIENFLDEVSKIIINKKPSIVGFSNNFQQICSTIAIANYIKKDNSSVITAMGGCNCYEPMSNEISKITPSIDYIFSGESEINFLLFCKNIIKKIKPEKKVIKCIPVKNLNLLPYPDFSDYFKQMQTNKIEEEIDFINFESSRGCWWKKESCCIFCSKDHFNYRVKLPGRIKKEISYLAKKYKVPIISTTDSIMPDNFPAKVFKNFKIKSINNIFYEIKPSMQFKNLKILKDNGINSCQPGIESFNDNILNILKKGVSASENIRFLRDCKTLGIIPKWNFLYAVPGDKKEYYYDMLNNILPYISHLKAPMKFVPINIYRYSPLFENTKKYNIKNIRPIPIYSYIFPKETNINNLAFYFEGEYDHALKNKKLKSLFFSVLNEWYSIWKKKDPPVLEIAKHKNNEYIIKDTRKVNKSNFSKINKKEYNFLMKFNISIHEKEINSLNIKKFTKLFENKYIIKIGTLYISLVNNAVKNNIFH